MTSEQVQTLFQTLTKNERSMICYAESCAVDRGGLMEAIRMNKEDLKILSRFAKSPKSSDTDRFTKLPKLWNAGRVPYGLLSNDTHWVQLTEAGWMFAALCRRKRAEARGPKAWEIFSEISEKLK